MFVHNMDPVAINFGIVTIRWYGIAYVIGMIAALASIQYADKRYGQSLINKKTLDDLSFYGILGVILGGRIGYTLFYHSEWLWKEPSKILRIWEGGMSFHGGLIGLSAAMLYVSRKYRLKFWYLSDLVACGAPLGIFFGRIANFINGELFGHETTLPWGVVFSNVDNVVRHPSQIYEAISEGVIIFTVIMTLVAKINMLRIRGSVTALFLVLYSLARIFCEIFRVPDQHIGYRMLGYITTGQILSFCMLIFGIYSVLRICINLKNNYN